MIISQDLTKKDMQRETKSYKKYIINDILKIKHKRHARDCLKHIFLPFSISCFYFFVLDFKHIQHYLKHLYNYIIILLHS